MIHVVLRYCLASTASTLPARASTAGQDEYPGRSVGALETKWAKLVSSALRNLVPDASPAPAPAPVRDEDESDDEVMPTRKKRGYVTLSDRQPLPSRPPDTSSSDDEVMPTKRPRGPPKRRGN